MILTRFKTVFKLNRPKHKYYLEFKLSNLSVIADFYKNGYLLNNGKKYSITRDLVLKHSLTPSNIIYFLKNSVQEDKIGSFKNTDNSAFIERCVLKLFKRLSKEKNYFAKGFNTGRYFTDNNFITSSNNYKNLKFVEDIIVFFGIKTENNRTCQFFNCNPLKPSTHKYYLDMVELFNDSNYRIQNKFERLHLIVLFIKIFTSEHFKHGLYGDNPSPYLNMIISKFCSAFLINSDFRELLKIHEVTWKIANKMIK